MTEEPPRARSPRPTPTGPTTEPPERQDAPARLVDRLAAAASSVPALAREQVKEVVYVASQRVTDKAVDMLSSNAEFMRIVGVACVSIAVLYWFMHGFMGFFPEERYKEALKQARQLETELRKTQTELSQTRASWIQCLEHLEEGDGDASGEASQ